MTLDMVNRGQKIEVISIPDEKIRVQAIRLGLYEGAKLVCSQKVLAGPVVLQNRLQEIAIGRKLAQTIKVKAV
ncbi:FeoA family protein [Tepidibacter formicigenes]|jgi:ferrous iron transport protein A|uniref:Ferrous iron transport protein A n=1 Tax=Tepidibacter formicigenes DSM 15518 TaxID=1123349 RepID=A0A1M6PCN1_9FIRM|nr:ferrous iron transport protein A [Tepidibacter formicigenes]SHK05713.1 ferrous iron transport protein A [Tepidibacter formicigenes DSM 15518]